MHTHCYSTQLFLCNPIFKTLQHYDFIAFLYSLMFKTLFGIKPVIQKRIKNEKDTGCIKQLCLKEKTKLFTL